MAQGYYNYFTNSNAASSAATSSHTEGYYTKPDDTAISVMAEESIDISHQLVRHLTKQMVDEADEIYVMTCRGDCPAFLADSEKVVFWNVADPWGTSLENFRHTRDIIKKNVKSILPKEKS